MKFTVTEKGVVSKSLVTAIRRFIEDGFVAVHVKWESELHRMSFLEVIDEFLTEKYVEGLITHGKVVCDERNNSSAAFQQGKFVLDVHFRQKNALIDTKLSYLVEPNGLQSS